MSLFKPNRSSISYVLCGQVFLKILKKFFFPNKVKGTLDNKERSSSMLHRFRVDGTLPEVQAAHQRITSSLDQQPIPHLQFTPC
ncbi:unnamed protein product [Victoria cruziana]